MPPRKGAKGASKSFGGTPGSPGNPSTTSDVPLLFSGLHFYFFPNSRTNRARALRIDKAVQHGAVFCQQLNPKVSHVIMDDGMHWDEFTKHHKDLSSVPKNAVIVNERYIADCLAYGIQLSHEQRVYQIPGRSSGAEGSKIRRIASEPNLPEKKAETPASKLQRSRTDQAVQRFPSPPSPDVEVNSIVDVIGRGPTVTAKARPKDKDAAEQVSRNEPVYKDDLSAMIDEAKATAHLPVESFAEENAPSSSVPSPAPVLEAASATKPVPPQSDTAGKIDPMIMQRPSDGAWVKLRCKECGESKFDDIKSFLKHCAFQHRHRFKTKEQAIENWGYPLPSYTPPSVADQPKATPANFVEPDVQAEAVSEDSIREETQERPAKRAKTTWQEQFVCMDKHDKEAKSDNPNAYVIEKLQEIADYYDRTGDHWRTLSFRKGVTSLKRQTKKIATKEEALKLPNVGGSIAEAIEKIVQTGKLQRLDATKDDPANQVLQLFMGIYGVGLAQATKWVQAGYKTLDDLRENEKVQLSENQKVGIEHYDDLQLRIPRAEVEMHADIFKSTLAGIDDAFEVTIGGSYRRGSANSGDIDLIITKPNANLSQIRHVILEQVVPELFEIGFLKAELARTSSDNGSKWHGCSAVDSGPWRRIDFLLVPWAEMGAALIYFTGNDIFNRSIRLLASRKGMRLNQRGLYKDVLRGKGRERITEGELLESKDEKKIFEILGVPWRPPEHRNC